MEKMLTRDNENVQNVRYMVKNMGFNACLCAFSLRIVDIYEGPLGSCPTLSGNK